MHLFDQDKHYNVLTELIGTLGYVLLMTHCDEGNRLFNLVEYSAFAQNPEFTPVINQLNGLNIAIKPSEDYQPDHWVWMGQHQIPPLEFSRSPYLYAGFRLQHIANAGSALQTSMSKSEGVTSRAIKI